MLRSFRRPLLPIEFFGQLFWVNWVKQTLVRSFVRFEFDLGGAHDQPKDFRLSVIEDLAQELRSDEYTAVLWHCERLLADANPPDALNDKIELFGSDVLVEGVGTLGWESPESSPENLASTALKEIRVRNPHHVRRSPSEIVGLDEEISVNRFHLQSARGNG